MTLPYVVDAQTPLSAAELQVLQDQFELEAASGHITTQTKFNYAWALIKSTQRSQMLQGIALLTGTPAPYPEIYRAEPPRRRECLYYLALGHYKLSNLDEAKRLNGTCAASRSAAARARAEEYAGAQPAGHDRPGDRQGCVRQLTAEGYMGLALLGGALTVTGVLATALLRRGRR